MSLVRSIPWFAAVAVVSLFTAGAAWASYIYNPSDFATEVVEYVEGTSIGRDFISGEKFNDPEAALGRPTVDTTGDGWYISMANPVPVVPTYAAFRASELVTIGNGGYLTVRFDHPVENDPDNPYGLDFIVFGNAFQVIGGGQGWTNGDPNDVAVGASVFAEAGIIQVSQDGVTWYTFDAGPYPDTFAPTLGRVYDEVDPDTSIGDWNEWWGDPTDPTLPVDPSLTAADFSGYTVAEMAAAYGGSAGGTGFDLDWLDVPGGLEWIQYIRVMDLSTSSATSEIDAFADVAPVPEPATLVLLAAGFGVAMRRRSVRSVA